MTDELSVWLRHEVRPNEYRAPLVPADAARLIAAGASVTVEDSPPRVFRTAEYADAGCAVAPAGSWVGAPRDSYVLGLKELPAEPAELRHRHIFFSHSFKNQPGARTLLGRFAAGGGTILDLEHLTDDTGRRLAAFGYWAGYLGAALAVLHQRGELDAPLVPTSRRELDRALARDDHQNRTAITVGALGRCGTGACDALTAAGIEPTRWDLAETRDLDRPALLRHDLLVNAVLTRAPTEPFVTPEDLAAPDRHLTTIADVTCDVGSPYHLLPIYSQTTSWDEPVLRVPGTRPPVDVISIDNLPSLLPHEASVSFSADLTPHLLTLPDQRSPWERCRRDYQRARDAATTGTEDFA